MQLIMGKKSFITCLVKKTGLVTGISGRVAASCLYLSTAHGTDKLQALPFYHINELHSSPVLGKDAR